MGNKHTKHLFKRFVRCLTSSIIFSSTTAFSQVVYMDPSSVINIAVDKVYGATILLPAGVHVATPTKFFRVTPVVDNATDPATPNQSEIAINSDKETTIFQILPPNKKELDKKDRINFILRNGKSVSAHLFVSDDVPDNVYQIKFTTGEERKNSSHNGNGFLVNEKDLMMHMLKDDPSDDRRIANIDVKLDKYPDLGLRLIRLYNTDDLSGYVFAVVNKSRKTIDLNATVLTLGKPNRIEMIQVDHETLHSCQENNDVDPRGKGCVTALRIVAKNGSENGLSIDSSSSAKSKMPFLVEHKSDKKRGGDL